MVLCWRDGWGRALAGLGCLGLYICLGLFCTRLCSNQPPTAAPYVGLAGRHAERHGLLCNAHLAYRLCRRAFALSHLARLLCSAHLVQLHAPFDQHTSLQCGLRSILLARVRYNVSQACGTAGSAWAGQSCKLTNLDRAARLCAAPVGRLCSHISAVLRCISAELRCASPPDLLLLEQFNCSHKLCWGRLRAHCHARCHMTARICHCMSAAPTGMCVCSAALSLGLDLEKRSDPMPTSHAEVGL